MREILFKAKRIDNGKLMRLQGRIMHDNKYKRNCEKVQYLRTVGNYRI
nr:MAG TPA: hypothetical protein [Caudoviricetes sp.]